MRSVAPRSTWSLLVLSPRTGRPDRVPAVTSLAIGIGWGVRVTQFGEVGSLVERRRWRAPDWAWVGVLGITAVTGALVVWFANQPGRMSFDSSHQLRQVLGEIPLDDWHPAFMTWTWRVLYEITGSVGSVAVVQICLAFGSALGLALVVYEATRSRPLSFGAVAIPLLPNVINLLGMLWKDTQMMVAFFAAVAALVAVRLLPSMRPTVRVGLMVMAGGLLLYGTLIRFNAFFAVFPLVVLLADTWRYRRSVPPPPQSRAALGRRSVVAVVGFAVLLAMTGYVFTTLVRPVETSAVSQIHLDGIIFTVPADEILAANLPEELERRLLAAQRKCEASGDTFNAYWRCFGQGRTRKPFEPIADRDKVRDLWVGSVLMRPDRYLPYQAQMLVRYLSTSTYFFQEESVEQVPPEYRGVPNGANVAIRDYVLGVGVGTLTWLYRPWFWLLASSVLLGLSGRALHLRFEIRALTGSAILYLLGYAVYAPTTDYRFTYWPAVAGILAGLLFLVDRNLARSGRGSPDVARGDGIRI